MTDETQPETPDENQAQAAALIEALVPKIAEAILPKISESVEVQIGGVLRKNDELLDKLAKQKIADDEVRKERAARSSGFDADAAVKPLRLSRADALDVKKYRAAKAEAERLGVSLEIVSGE
ncbi:hypothetical protein [Acidimangrovimonas sediminis]|uniref:hypothetical protein n=1 Tax=Acidimangrovimonas sediminis TaxID=2056283 RepID=UPI000C80BA57|nr:hypothetical protein [Acidimangrovimonas sediminis]